MNASRVGLPVAAILVAALARPAASDSCPEAEIDAQGKCPKKAPPVKAPPVKTPPVKTPPLKRPPPSSTAAPSPTELDIQGADIVGIEVSLDDQPVGPAPLIVRTTPGSHLIEVRRDGYWPYANRLGVEQGQRKLVQVKLVPAQVVQPTAAQKASQAPAAGPGSCPPEMVQVPAATFQMGLPEGVAGWDEGLHTVTLSRYCIDKTEVTVKAYRACVAAKGCSATDFAKIPRGYGGDCNRDNRPDHPINCVDWNQAATYCKWAGKRLPTEAEWEYAARGPDGRMFPWGNEAPSAKLLNAFGTEHREARRLYDGSDGWKTTAPVGSFPAGASPFGVLDMAGNVFEWTGDWHERYAATAATNPQGAPNGTFRVTRGSGWPTSGLTYIFAARRSQSEPTARYDFLGFRCARGD